jgi:hypothetical protein
MKERKRKRKRKRKRGAPTNMAENKTFTSIMMANKVR